MDVDEFRPRPRDEALAACSTRPGATRRTRQRERAPPGRGQRRTAGAFFAGDEPTVVYFGKLIYNKGVHLLLEALRELERAR